jgi:MFS family permease
MIMVGIYTSLGETPLWLLLIVSVFLFISVASRMIASSALMSGVPEPKDRGAFMGINSSVQYLAGGISAYSAGLIVYQDKTGVFHNYEVLGYVVIASMVVCLIMMYFIHKMVTAKTKFR